MNIDIAPQTDRLVWAVADRVRAQHRNGELPGLQLLSPPALSRMLNLVQYMYPDIGEAVIRRRYIYATDEQITQFIDELLELALVERVGDRLRPTDQLPEVLEAYDDALKSSARTHWHDHLAVVEPLLPLARAVIEACPQPEALMSLALHGPEADDACQLLYQRLASIRLLRNEAHVRAWTAFDLGPREIEILTHGWSGSKIQNASEPTAKMVERGLAADGAVTEEGLALRQEIEVRTNAEVTEAFSAIDQDAMLEGLVQLPGPLD